MQNDTQRATAVIKVYLGEAWIFKHLDPDTRTPGLGADSEETRRRDTRAIREDTPRRRNKNSGNVVPIAPRTVNDGCPGSPRDR